MNERKDGSKQEFNPKTARERFNQADVLPRKDSWPKPATQAPRLGGMMGRVVRGKDGAVVTLVATPEGPEVVA